MFSLYEYYLLIGIPPNEIIQIINSTTVKF